MYKRPTGLKFGNFDMQYALYGFRLIFNPT